MTAWRPTFILTLAMMGHLLCMTVADGRYRLLQAVPVDRPSWVVTEPAPTAADYYFVGLSNPRATESDALAEAKQHVLHQIADFVGMRIFRSAVETRTRNSEAANGQVMVEGESIEQSLSDIFISKMKDKDRYIEQVHDPASKQNRWVARLLMVVPREEIEKAAADVQTRRERYGTGAPHDAVIFLTETSTPYDSELRYVVTGYLSKYGIAVLDPNPKLPAEIPILNAAIRVYPENTIYDRQFIAARIVLRVQHHMPAGVVVTDHCLAGTQRAYAHTVETAIESAVEDFLDDKGMQLIRAIRR